MSSRVIQQGMLTWEQDQTYSVMHRPSVDATSCIVGKPYDAFTGLIFEKTAVPDWPFLGSAPQKRCYKERVDQDMSVKAIAIRLIVSDGSYALHKAS